MSLGDIPVKAKRTHPRWGNKQLNTAFILHELLEPDRPEDAWPTWP